MGGAPAQTRSERVLEKPNEPPLLEGHTSGSGEGIMEHTFELTDNVPNTPHDSPLIRGYTPGSDEGMLKLEELITMCIKLSKQVLDLEKENDAQAVEILKLKKRVKKLERKRKSSISHPKRRIYRQVESFDDDLDKEDASKQGRNSDKTKPMFKDINFDVLDDTMEDVDATLVTPPTTTTVFDDDEDLTIAQTLETESVEKTKNKVQGDAQIELDAEVALRLQAELDEELRVERERQEEASKVTIAEMFDEVQARMDADYELTARITQEEQEKYTIKERARLLAEFFERRKKQLAAERVEAIRNKPPTKTQLRNLMMTYLKNMGGYKHSQLKGKSYEEIQGLYERQQKRIHDFTPMDSEKEAQKSDEEAEECEKEKEELRLSLKEYQLLGKMEAKDMYVYRLTRSGGSLSYHRDIQALLRRLDREDLNDLYRMIFNLDEKDALWMNQLYWKLLRWKLYEICGVHTLFMDGTPIQINMLVEKNYPLIKELLKNMLNLQLEAEEESTMAFKLIKFIKSLLEE
ncbi:hypothetical protein Tco_1257944 [Tanacetum coccineum]